MWTTIRVSIETFSEYRKEVKWWIFGYVIVVANKLIGLLDQTDIKFANSAKIMKGRAYYLRSLNFCITCQYEIEEMLNKKLRNMPEQVEAMRRIRKETDI